MPENPPSLNRLLREIKDGSNPADWQRRWESIRKKEMLRAISESESLISLLPNSHPAPFKEISETLQRLQRDGLDRVSHLANVEPTMLLAVVQKKTTLPQDIPPIESLDFHTKLALSLRMRSKQKLEERAQKHRPIMSESLLAFSANRGRIRS